MAVEKGNRGNGTPAACGVQNLDHALTWGLSSMSFLGELGMATGSEVSGPGRPAGEAVDAGREYSLVIPQEDSHLKDRRIAGFLDVVGDQSLPELFDIGVCGMAVEFERLHRTNISRRFAVSHAFPQQAKGTGSEGWLRPTAGVDENQRPTW